MSARFILNVMPEHFFGSRVITKIKCSIFTHDRIDSRAGHRMVPATGVGIDALRNRLPPVTLVPQDLEQLQDLFVNANDASVAFIAVVLLFCLPNGMGKGERLLDWRTANEVPWGLLILVGAGMCLGTAFKESGLSAALASALTGLGKVDPVYLILSVALLVTFLTEMTSNTATTNILMPILGAVAVASMLDPKLLLLPATISASCAFMLPVATMPNAVVFGTGEVSIKRMAREGFVLNLAGAVIVTFVCYIFLK